MTDAENGPADRDCAAETASQPDTAPPPLNGISASVALKTIAAEDEVPRISIGHIDTRLGDRAFGIVMIILAFPNCLPLPPGGSTLFGVLLMLVAVQVLFGRHRLWLPSVVRRRSVTREDFRKVVQKVAPILQRVESLCRPRLSWLAGGWAERLIGFVVIVLAIVIALPIPIVGNLPPAVIVGILSIGLIERDGAAVLAGLALAVLIVALNAGVVTAAVVAVIELWRHLLSGIF